jgi:multiple sugar transport system ATP-binding protein
MIYVTHDQTEAMTLGHRIAVLNKGKLMQLDTPLHLYNYPSNKFVAGFIGSPAMNFLTGTIEHADGYFFIHETNECKIHLGDFISSTLKKYIGRKIIAGIRPEDIFIYEDANTKADCILKVIAFENMGNEQLVYLSLAAQTLIARRPPSETIEIGKETGVRFSIDKIIFMDEESEEVIKDNQ